VQGCKRITKSCDLLKIWAKALKIRVKIAPNVVWLQKLAPKVCIKTHEELFLVVTPKRDLHDLCGRKFVSKSCTKNFSGKFGEIRAKSFAPQKFSCPYTYDEKAPPTPLPLFWKGRGENALAMSPFSGVRAYCSTRTLFTRCCWLPSATAMTNYQRSPKTEQFITAKISGNALKQGSRTQSVLRQRRSQLQKYKAARMSRRIAVDQKVCGWDGGHPGLTVWNLITTQELRMRMKYARKFSFFVMFLLYVQLLRGEKIQACVSRYDQSAWTANEWRKSKRSTYCKHRCTTVLAPKRNGKLVMHHKIK